VKKSRKRVRCSIRLVGDRDTWEGKAKCGEKSVVREEARRNREAWTVSGQEDKGFIFGKADLLNSFTNSGFLGGQGGGGKKGG